MGTAVKKEQKYSYKDYITWPDDERWEIIDGVAYNMTPAPTIKHQDIAGIFYSKLQQYLSGKQCRVFISPIDVVLSEYDVVQPDVIVVCDEKKITEQNIKGAPDLVMEVLSPSTALKDKREKKTLFEKSGVKEYILIDPVELYVERFILKGKQFSVPEIFGTKEKLPLKCLESIEIPLWEVFGVEAPEKNIFKKP